MLAEGASHPGAFDAGLCHAGTRQLAPGDRITAWLDGAPAEGAARARAWQIRAADVLLCDHASNSEAARRAGTNAGVMGGTFAVIGLALLAAPFLVLRLRGRGDLNP